MIGRPVVTGTTETVSYVSPADEAWDAFQELFMQYRPRMLEIHAEYELKPPPVALALKAIDEPTPMGKVAEHLCCDGSTVTWIVDRLEERGLVERQADPRDRRVRLVALTDEGRRIRNEIRAKLSQAPPAIAALSEEDQIALRDILRRAVRVPADR
jgi:MarR family transcriptional regulator, organic hydroperoxide resistance regulator